MNNQFSKKLLPGRLAVSSLSLATLLLLGCQADSESAETKDALPAKDLSISPYLGQAYNAASKNVLNLKCISYEEIPVSESAYLEGNLAIKMDMSQEEIMDSLSGNLGVEVKFPLVKAKAGANYAAQSASSESSRTFSLDYTVRGPNRKVNLDSLALSPIGKKYADERSADLAQLCGDSFVSEVTQGAKLLITMKFDFYNKQDKQEIGGFLDIDFSNPVWKAKLEGDLKSLNSKDAKRISLSIMGTQIGGDVMGLSKIIPANFASCSLANPEPCIMAMEKAIDYAQNDFVAGVKKNGFSSMLYMTSKYSESGLDALVPPQGYPIVEEAVLVMQDEINMSYAHALAHQKRAATIINQFASYLPSNLLDDIKDIKNKSLKNASDLVRVGVYCYENPNQKCLEEGQKVFAELENYDVKKLSLEVDEILNFARCEKARKFALLQGLISRSDYDYYRKAEWAPEFRDPEQPGRGVDGWTRCLSVVTSYGTYFDNMYE